MIAQISAVVCHLLQTTVGRANCHLHDSTLPPSLIHISSIAPRKRIGLFGASSHVPVWPTLDADGGKASGIFVHVLTGRTGENRNWYPCLAFLGEQLRLGKRER
jgi:hypothetical protein